MVLQNYSGLLTIIVIKSVAFIVILIFGLVIGKVLSKLIERILNEFGINKLLRKRNIKFPLEEFIGQFVRYIIYLVSIILALNQIGLSIIIPQIILAIILILITLYILIRIIDFLPNLTAGFIIKSKQNLKKGKNIEFKNIKGKILKINLTDIKVKTKDNEIMYVPYRYLLKKEF